MWNCLRSVETLLKDIVQGKTSSTEMNQHLSLEDKECERLCKETDATTLRTQQSIDHKFAQRIGDIQFWKEELKRKLSDNASETDRLLQRKEQLEKALVTTQFPLEIAQSCLSFREKRVAIDLVYDDVEIQLLKVCSCVCTTTAL